MADHRALAAVRRIELALARIQSVASGPTPSSNGKDQELERLRSAHDNLRHHVSGAIGQIDRLLQSDRQD